MASFNWDDEELQQSLLKKIQVQAFSCEFWEIFRNAFLI